MAIVTRKFMCKDCEEIRLIKYSQEEMKTKENPETEDEYLLLTGLCKGCFDDKME